MTAVARLWVVYFTAFPVQRYVAGCGAALLLLGIAGLAFFPRGALLALMLGITFLLFPVLLPAGWVFRVLSAPRRHRLLPRFRIRMLVSIFFVLALPVLLALMLLASGAPLPAGPVLVYPVLMLSAYFWMFFFVPASFWGVLLFVLALLVASRMPEPQLAGFMEGIGPAVGAAVLVAGWTAFVVWYLRAARIGPFRVPLQALQQFGLRLQLDLRERVPVHDAITVYVWNRTRPDARQWFWMMVTVVALGGVITFLVRTASDLMWPTVVLLVVLLTSFAVGKAAAHRARLLWLKAPLSRTEIYSTIEQGLWRMYVPTMLGMVLVFLAFIGMFQRVSVPLLVALFPFAAAAVPFGCYLGLMWVRGWRVLDAAMAVVLLLSLAGAAWIVLRDPARYDLLLALAAFDAAAALACRAIGLHRWPRVDWLEVRLPRRSGGPSLTDMLAGRTT